MNSTDREYLEEYLKRKNRSILDHNFPKQTAFILDSSKRKAAQCSRRSGKSYGMGLYLFKEAIANPGVTCLYIALTRETAKRIMYKDVLKVINRNFGLHAVFNDVTLTVKLPNESVIYLLGLDQSDHEAEKLLGQKYKLAVIDESASYRVDLRDVVYGKLDPAMADLEGTICMIGTTSNITNGLFYDITNGKEPGWSVHKWDYRDNPYTKDKVEKQKQELISKNPAIADTPLFKQMYLNEWVVDHDKLVYKFSESRNIIHQIPTQEYSHVLGVDLGYEDDTAFVVASYSTKDPNLYIQEAIKRKKLDITSVASMIKYLDSKYNFDRIVIDGSAKQAVEEMKARHGISLYPTEKSGKSDFIEIMNAELIQGTIKLVEDKTYDLVDEWKSLIWDDRSVSRIENPTCPNHLSDATLYAWRYCYQYLFTAKAPPKTEEEKLDQWEEMEAEKLSRPAKPFWEEEIY